MSHWRPHLRSRSQLLASKLESSCCTSDEDLARIKATGQLLPTTSLKFRSTRRKLKWVLALSSDRYFTYKRVLLAMRLLRISKPFALPNVPGFDEESWILNQAGVIVRVLQRARKCTGPMADLETQPWPEDWTDICGCDYAWHAIAPNICCSSWQEEATPATTPERSQERRGRHLACLVAAWVQYVPVSRSRWQLDRQLDRKSLDSNQFVLHTRAMLHIVNVLFSPIGRCDPPYQTTSVQSAARMIYAHIGEIDTDSNQRITLKDSLCASQLGLH